MANSFIHYTKSNNSKYGYLYTPRRDSNGNKVNDPVYIGKVIDEANNLYKNKERGVFKYTIENGYESADYTEINVVEENLILDFGDVFVFDEVFKKSQFYEIVKSILPNEADTLLALMYYKILGNNANVHAEEWWNGSYARILFPNAKLESQRISEFLARLGDEKIQREFFKRYLQFFPDEKGDGVLIDSMGLANKIDTYLTAVNNHCGNISNEMRLILILDRKTRMPLFFRYIQGNIVDVSTLTGTIEELKQFGVSICFAIMDAGYFSEQNITPLLESGISFVMRMKSNLNTYKAILHKNAENFETAENAVIFNNRLLYVKKVQTELYGHTVNAYVCMDYDRRYKEKYEYMLTAKEEDKTDAEIDEELKGKGMFVIITPEDVTKDEILPLYYTRQEIEQYFDVGNNLAGLTPIRVHKEEGIRGHLMLVFLVSIVLVTIEYLLSGESKKNSRKGSKSKAKKKYNKKDCMVNFRNLKCKVYDEVVLVKETTRKMNEIAKILGVDIPTKIILQ